MTTPLHELQKLGQSVWLDFISRDLLDSGDLQRMLDELAVSGVTSNPTIFDSAIRAGSAYDEQIRSLREQGAEPAAIFEALEVDDIRRACDVLRGVYDNTEGVDGFVSIELEPDLAFDAEASLVRARQLWAAVDRPNLLVKIPGTKQALPAIEDALAEGINVNITLLFAVDAYRDVMERYLRALERRVESGLPVDRIASVASFFVSRVDTAVDTELQRIAGGDALLGRAAVANALSAWDAHREVFDGDRFASLQRQGARAQRPLWASTGTKNPRYSDVLYVQELIAPGTVNTMPLATMKAFAEHGEARITIDDTSWAKTTLQQLDDRGINVDDITERLLAEGVSSFQKSYDSLLEAISEKASALPA